MIPSKAQIAYGVFGAWRLAHLDPRGLTCFDDSDEGFVKSFFAAVLTLPAMAAFTLMDYAGLTLKVGLPHAATLELLSLVAAWVLWPVLAYFLCIAMDRQRQYYRYIVAYNWAYVIVVAVALPVRVLEFTGALGGLGEPLVLLVYLLSLIYAGVIAKLALEITAGAAFALVIVDLLASFMLHDVTRFMILAPSGSAT